MSSQILLVKSESDASSTFEQLLVSAGHSVTAVTSFEAAALPASWTRPDLLLTAIRLGRFNGLHLALRFRLEHPGVPIIAIGDEAEVGLAAEAMQLRVRFVPKSTAPGRFLRYIDELLAGGKPRDLVSTRRWSRRAATLPARLSVGEAQVLDIGYGGMCLACAEPQVREDGPVDVSLPSVGMVVSGVFRWAKPAADPETWACGFELDTVTSDTRRWRRVVDSVLQS